MGAACSLVTAIAFAALPLLWLVLPGFSLAHPWIFSAGAAAFGANLLRPGSPLARGLILLIQAVCLFEVLGFSLGLTFTFHPGGLRWEVADWRLWLTAWGLLILTASSMLLTSADRQVAR